MKRVRIEVPATSANLGPGFDTLGLALRFTDVIEAEIDPDSDQIVLEQVTGEPDFTLDPEDNLLCHAYRRWGDGRDSPLPGIRFRLESRIPVARGLGSSAASVVAGLVAGAWAEGARDCTNRLLRIATDIEGHPDNVVAAILGGLTVAFQNDSGVHALNVANHLEMAVSVFVPDDTLLTSKARACLPPSVPLRDAVFDIGRAAYLTTAILWGRWDTIGPAMDDRLHQPERTRYIPALPDLIAAAREAGAYGAALSGAGPSVIALSHPTKGPAVMAAMESRAREQGWPGRGMLTGVRESGYRLTEQKEDSGPAAGDASDT